MFFVDSTATKFRLRAFDKCVGMDANLGSTQVLLNEEEANFVTAPLGGQGTITYSFTQVNVADLRALARMDDQAGMADQLAVEKEALQGEVATLQAEVAALQGTVASLESAMAEDGGLDEAREAALADAKAEAEANAAKVADLEAAVAALNEEVEALTGQHAAAAEAAEAATAQLGVLQAALGEQEQSEEAAAAAAEAAAARAASMQAERDAFESQVASAMAAAEAAESRAAEAEAQVAELSAANEELAAAADGVGDEELMATIAGLRGEVAALQQRLGEESAAPEVAWESASEVPFTHASTGGDWMLAVDEAGTIYRKASGDIAGEETVIEGRASCVSTNGTCAWVVNSEDVIYACADVGAEPDGMGWYNVPGRLRQVHVGGDYVVGTNHDGNFYLRKTDAEPDHPWVQLNGRGVQIVTNGEYIWHINASDKIYKGKIAGAEESRHIDWEEVPGLLTSLSIDSSRVWGTNVHGNVYFKDAAGLTPHWTQVAEGMKLVVPHRHGIAAISAEGTFVTRASVVPPPPTDAAVLADVPQGYLRMFMHMAHRTYKTGALLAVKSAAYNLALRVEDEAGERVRAHNGGKLGPLKLINVRPHPKNSQAVLLQCRAPGKSSKNYQSVGGGALQATGGTAADTQFVPEWSPVNPGKLTLHTPRGYVRFASSGTVDVDGMPSARTEVHIVPHPHQTKQNLW